MPVVRPRVNEDYLFKIRMKYPKETAGIHTIEGLVEFAIKKALEQLSPKKKELG